MASTYTTKLHLEKPDGDDNISVLAINGNMDIIDNTCGLTDVTSHFTVNGTYCEGFHAYKIGRLIFVTMKAKAGTPDQANLITNISTGYRPIGDTALSTFWMNWTDAQKHTAAYVMTSAIQLRTVGDLEGSGGVLVSGCYMI